MTFSRRVAASDIYPLSPMPWFKSAAAYATLVADGVSVTGLFTVSFGSCTSGSISGAVLTTNGSPNAGTLSGKFEVGQTVYVGGVSQGVTITSLGTGTGGAGTYNLSSSPGDVSGVAISASTPNVTIANASFAAGDVGKAIRLPSIGANGVDLLTTIAAVAGSTSITIASPPVSAVFSGRGGNQFATISYGTDNSTAVKTAHDAATAAGQRYLWIDPGSYWVGNLTASGNVIYVGIGASFLGHRRYRVVPPTARGPYVIRSSLDPAVHLAQFKAQASPRVAFIGDSIGTPNFIGNNAVYIAQEIKKELMRRYPSKTISFFDFAIGGCAWSDLASGSEINFAGRGLSTPYWHSAGHTWLYDIQNYAWGAATAPHTVFIELGTNTVTNAGAEYAGLYSAISQIQAFSTTPDIVLLTPGTATLMNASYWTDTSHEAREGFAALIRGFCQRNGLGYLDVHRHARMLRDGLDPCNDDIPQATITGFSGSMNVPVTLPVCRDFAIQFNMPGANVSSNISTTNSLNFIIGNSSGPGYPDILQIYKTVGGNWAVSLYISGQGVAFGPIDTGVAMPSTGTIYFEATVKDNYIRFAANSSNFGAGGLMPSVWEGMVERKRVPFMPTIYYGNYINTNMTPTELCLSSEMPIMPNMIDSEMFGSGSPSVHPTTNGQSQMYRALLEGERFY